MWLPQGAANLGRVCSGKGGNTIKAVAKLKGTACCRFFGRTGHGREAGDGSGGKESTENVLEVTSSRVVLHWWEMGNLAGSWTCTSWGGSAAA